MSLQSRWWALLSCAQQDALASTLVDDQELLLHGHDAVEPPLVDILMEELWNTPQLHTGTDDFEDNDNDAGRRFRGAPAFVVEKIIFNGRASFFV